MTVVVLEQEPGRQPQPAGLGQLHVVVLPEVTVADDDRAHHGLAGHKPEADRQHPVLTVTGRVRRTPWNGVARRQLDRAGDNTTPTAPAITRSARVDLPAP